MRILITEINHGNQFHTDFDLLPSPKVYKIPLTELRQKGSIIQLASLPTRVRRLIDDIRENQDIEQITLSMRQITVYRFPACEEQPVVDLVIKAIVENYSSSEFGSVFEVAYGSDWNHLHGNRIRQVTGT